MGIEITGNDWGNTKLQNEQLIKTNRIQIMMAEEIIKLCDRKLEEIKKEKTNKGEKKY